jgi:hypothetical protein
VASAKKWLRCGARRVASGERQATKGEMISCDWQVITWAAAGRRREAAANCPSPSPAGIGVAAGRAGRRALLFGGQAAAAFAAPTTPPSGPRATSMPRWAAAGPAAQGLGPAGQDCARALIASAYATPERGVQCRPVSTQPRDATPPALVDSCPCIKQWNKLCSSVKCTPWQLSFTLLTPPRGDSGGPRQWAATDVNKDDAAAPAVVATGDC